MTVRELNQDQLEELKWNYFYSDDYNPTITNGAGLPVLFANDIPNDVIFEIYSGYYFVNDDFGCSAGEYEPVIDYDTPEEIQKCLHCEKTECDNCLKTINGV